MSDFDMSSILEVFKVSSKRLSLGHLVRTGSQPFQVFSKIIGDLSGGPLHSCKNVLRMCRAISLW